MGRRRARRPIAAIEDFGPQERLARGEVVVIGIRPRRQGRALTVVSRLDRHEQATAAQLCALFERAHYPGFACSNMERLSSGSFNNLPPAEAACSARRALAAIQRRIAAEHWAVVWHILFFSEAQALFAIRAGIDRHHVKARLQAALQAVAALSHVR